MPQIKQEWHEITIQVIKEAKELFDRSFIDPLKVELAAIPVQEIAHEFLKRLDALLELANQFTYARSAPLSESPASESPILEDSLVPIFKGIFLRARLAKARALDKQRSRTTNPQIIGALEDKLRVYDAVIREMWFQAAAAEYHPALSPRHL